MANALFFFFFFFLFIINEAKPWELEFNAVF